MINTSEDCIRFKEDLNCVSLWLDKWQLKLNASNCDFKKTFSPYKFDYNIKGNYLSWKPLIGYLGVYINCKLDWSDHCKITVAKETS